MDILVERHRNRIHLFSPWEMGLADVCKSILGFGITRNKDGSFRSWTYPLDWSTCLQLRQIFGRRLDIGPKLALWARVEARRQGRARAIAGRTAVDLAKVAAVAPVLAEAMGRRTYQQVGSAFCAHTKSALLADEPGLGKTLQCMGAMIEADIFGVILVLAPQTALDITWREELARWLPQDASFACLGSAERRHRAIAEAKKTAERFDRVWLLCNYEMLRADGPKVVVGQDEWGEDIKVPGPTPYPELLETEWASVVVDESQRLLVTQTPVAAKQSLQRQGAAQLQVARGGLRLAMSGTPNRGHTENLWGTLNWLFPSKYTSFNRWVDQNFEYLEDTMTGEKFLQEMSSVREKELYRELDSIIIRRTKREVAPDMPPKMYAGWHLVPEDENSPVGVWLPMLPHQRKAYDQMATQAEALLDGGTLMANGVLAELTRLKQFANSCARLTEDEELELMLPSNKLQWLIPWLAERGIEKGGERKGGKVILASPSSQLLDLLEQEMDRLGIAHTKIHGGITGGKRQQAAHVFQDAESGVRLMLLGTKAGGVSLTLDQADEVVFFGETWDPDDQTQVEDRADRVSRSNHQVTVWYVRSLGTLEEAIAADNESLDKLNHELMDGRRGVKRAKQLLNYKSHRRDQ